MKTMLTLVFIMVFNLAHAEELIIDNRARKLPRAIHNAEKILKKVKTFTGFNVDVGTLTIIVLPTRGDLEIEYVRLHGTHGGFVAWYETGTNTIYTYPSVTSYVLAHEFTHALINRVGLKVDKAHKEDLPHSVEKNINLGWL